MTSFVANLVMAGLRNGNQASALPLGHHWLSSLSVAAPLDSKLTHV
jgi:hypothetical protein